MSWTVAIYLAEHYIFVQYFVPRFYLSSTSSGIRLSRFFVLSYLLWWEILHI